MKSLLIWGAGDQGTVTLDCALATKAYGKIGLLAFEGKGRREIAGYPIFQEGNVDLKKLLGDYDEAIVATGDNGLREEKAAVLALLGVPLATVVHPTAFLSASAKVSAGCTVLAQAAVNTNARVGAGCIVNTAAVVEHDCVVGDFVNICPRAAMAGHIRVGSKAFLGIGCTIKDAIVIGTGAVVGAGAVVIRDVPDGAVVVGVPAKRIK